MDVSEIVRGCLAEAGCEGLRHPQLACSCHMDDGDFMQCGDCTGCLPASFNAREELPSGAGDRERV